MTRIPYGLSPEEQGAAGQDMHRLMRELYPLCRSITGDGVRQTHAILKKHLPLETHEVPTGTKAFDWTIPREWNIRDAYVIDPRGRKVIDFKKCNLHVLNYSIPVRAKMTLSELKPHLHTLPEHPDAIPYLTSYYQENWGFCLSHRAYQELAEGEYEVVIDSTLADGSLTYSEYFLKGRTSDEILVSCYTCHPSTCNDNLSGVVLTAALARILSRCSLKYSYRFLFVPETIGAITWLSRNRTRIKKIKYGFVVTCVGNRGTVHYQKTRHGATELDQAVTHVLRHSGQPYAVRDFIPYGSDERQYSSPAFQIPVGSIMKTPYGRFPEYHSSADNLDFVQPDALADSLSHHLAATYVLEHNATYINRYPRCEPQFSKRGLHKAIGGRQNDENSDLALYWILNFSDGEHTLLDIADRASLPFHGLTSAAEVLSAHGILKRKGPSKP